MNKRYIIQTILQKIRDKLKLIEVKNKQKLHKEKYNIEKIVD